MLALRCFPPLIRGLESLKMSVKPNSVVVCAAKGPRPRYARVWKTNKRIGTISKSTKLLQCIKELSNVKEEVYGALDAFIAWDLEFPLITVKKAIKSLEEQKEWKRVIQVTKWMLSKGQGRTMGTYSILLSALVEDGRLKEAEELWNKLFSDNLDSTPRNLLNKMIAIYYHREMHDKMFEIFADMEELGIRPNISIVTMMGNVFQNLGMLDKYEKLQRKYPPPKWKFKFIRGKRVKIRVNNHSYNADQGVHEEEQSLHSSKEELEISEASYDGDEFELKEVDLVEHSNNWLEGLETSEDTDGFELEELDQVSDSNNLLEDGYVISSTKETRG